MVNAALTQRFKVRTRRCHLEPPGHESKLRVRSSWIARLLYRPVSAPQLRILIISNSRVQNCAGLSAAGAPLVREIPLPFGFAHFDKHSVGLMDHGWPRRMPDGSGKEYLQRQFK